MRIKQEPEMMTSILRGEFRQEKNDCSVIAVSIACGVDYAAAHDLCEKAGRKPGKGMFTAEILRAVNGSGCTFVKIDPKFFINRYPSNHQILKNVTSHHPVRFKNIWADGFTYLLFIKGHVLAVKNGQCGDWAKNRAKRVRQIYQINQKGN